MTKELEDKLNAAQTEAELDAICKAHGISIPPGSVIELDPSVQPSEPLLPDELEEGE